MSGDFCYVGEQYCVAKMLVSERCRVWCPLAVRQGLAEPAGQPLQVDSYSPSQRWTQLSPEQSCLGCPGAGEMGFVLRLDAGA